MKNFCLNFHVINSETEKFHNDSIYCYDVKNLELLFSEISRRKLKVSLSFDDGHLSDLKLVEPLLKKHKLKAIFFVIGKEIAQNSTKWEQTKTLSDLGYTIGSHSFNHRDLTKLNQEQLTQELVTSKKTIEDCIQKEVVDFAFPYGTYNKKTIEAVLNEGYTKIYTTNAYSLASSKNVIHRFNVRSKHSVGFLCDLLTFSSFKSRFWRFMILTKNIMKLRW